MVATLSEIQRAAVTLYYFEDHSVERVAEILGLNVNTVKTHLRRARGVLREAWVRSQSEGGS
jgi:RNA polymerase sigma-70 factor (ECF subfamily)